jgi:hypothetical protein
MQHAPLQARDVWSHSRAIQNTGVVGVLPLRQNAIMGKRIDSTRVDVGVPR